MCDCLPDACNVARVYKSLGFSKKLENLENAVALFLAYYNFCWRPGKMRVTPAMAAGVTSSLWTIDDLMAAK